MNELEDNRTINFSVLFQGGFYFNGKCFYMNIILMTCQEPTLSIHICTNLSFASTHSDSAWLSSLSCRKDFRFQTLQTDVASCPRFSPGQKTPVRFPEHTSFLDVAGRRRRRRILEPSCIYHDGSSVGRTVGFSPMKFRYHENLASI